MKKIVAFIILDSNKLLFHWNKDLNIEEKIVLHCKDELSFLFWVLLLFHWWLLQFLFNLFDNWRFLQYLKNAIWLYLLYSFWFIQHFFFFLSWAGLKQSIIQLSIIFGFDKIRDIIFDTIFKIIISLFKQIFLFFELVKVPIFSFDDLSWLFGEFYCIRLCLILFSIEQCFYIFFCKFMSGKWLEGDDPGLDAMIGAGEALTKLLYT